MNKNSVICNYINDHPETWRDDFVEKQIIAKQQDNLCIFNYNIDADFSDPVIQEARGIIINLETLDVICWPFRKFGNYGESYVDTIDWNTAHVQEKVDGSIIKMYFYQNEWKFATNAVIDAAEADFDGFMTFLDLVRQTRNYWDIPFNKLDKDKTYIFELVGSNRVVINYYEPMLYHIGTRNNLSGQETVEDIGIAKPKEYPLRSIDECIEAANALNRHGEVTQEGFVVVDKDFHRIKVKSPAYIAIHHVINNGVLTKERVVNLLLDQCIDIEAFIVEYQEYEDIIRFYQFQIAKVKREMRDFVRVTRLFYEEYSHDRKAVAMVIKDKKYAFVGFMALDRDINANEILDIISKKTLIKYIADYDREDVVDWFQKSKD